MKTQISRLPQSLFAPWSGVYQQQGRMLTDADWNAQAEVMKATLSDALVDVIGSGTPDDGGAVVPDGAGGFGLVLGAVYAEGLRGTLRAEPPQPVGAPFEFSAQADFPAAPEPPAAPHLLYLDLWERTVTAHEDAGLMDPGLHGADTTTRSRVMAQVKWGAPDFDPEDPAVNPPIGAALATVALRGDIAAADPCEPCADEIALPDRVGSYLFRTEVHRVDYDAGAPVRVILKWSRENGAEAATIGSEPPGFIASDWTYDFYHGAPMRAESESHLGYHAPDVLAAGWTPTRSVLVQGYPETPPAGFDLVRRWDGYVELEKAGSDWRVAFDLEDGLPVHRGFDRGQRLSPLRAVTEHGHVREGPTVLLALDTTMVSLELADHPLLAGDFWHVAVREAVHASGDTILAAAPPMGIRHRYMGLAWVDGTTVTPCSGSACRRHRFPRLTDIAAEDVCYDNGACSMPGVETVQDALDHLCRTRDLRWHNKHLHGWGIVCGLIVECGEVPDEESPVLRDVRVTSGYALTCEGGDIVVRAPLPIDLLSLIEEHDATAETPILTDGDGTACMVLTLDAGQPVVRVEPHVPATGGPFAGLLEGTLLGDFWQHCVGDLIKALQAEISLISGDDLSRLEDDPDEPPVSTERKKTTSVWNLLIQLVNKANGAYVYLSHKEHVILRTLYTNLRELLRSKTFCGMFRGDEFPPYPFPDARTDTWFGKNSHVRILADPTGRRVYTWGGGDATINVYDAQKGVLVEVLTMPAAAGAEVTALALNPDGSLLHAVASVHGQDSILGTARTGDTHVWELSSIVLCDLIIPEMVVDREDEGLIYALGAGRGVFFLRPKLLRDEATPKPEPTYPFLATGHMLVEPRIKLIYATSASSTTAGLDEGQYDEIRVMPMASPAAPIAPPAFPLRDIAGAQRRGRDGMALRPILDRRGRSLFVAVDPVASGEDKAILAVPAMPDGTLGEPERQLAVEDTRIALAYHEKLDLLLATFEDSYRLMTVRPDEMNVVDFRIPVQIQPVALTVGTEAQVYVLNFLSNTVTAFPMEEVNHTDEKLKVLAEYRHRVLLAFLALFGGLLQYLKDCFCHHLMVKCPSCGEDSKIYLACVEVRDGSVHNVCNFAKRKYVKSFPTVDYWLSLIPIGALIQRAVTAFCCAILPNLFDRYKGRVAPPPPPPEEGARTGSGKAFRGSTSRNLIYRYKTTDVRRTVREETGGVKLYGQMIGDVATEVRGPDRAGKGIRKQTMLEAPVSDARRELERSGIKVAAIEPYDPKLADRYIADYARTPGRLAPGTEVVIYERDGRAVFFAEKRRAPAVAIDPEFEARITVLEARKAAVEDIAGAERELAELQAQKTGILAELGAARGQIEALRIERAAEEGRVQELVRTRDVLRTDVDTLNQRVTAIADHQRRLRIDIDRLRPIGELEGVTPAMSEALANAGVRTIGDLAAADPAAVRGTRAVRDVRAANALIRRAKQRLE
jgi:hypothetical protein